MAEGKFDVLGPLFSAIGAELAQIVGGNPDGVYLYAEGGEGWLGASVFLDEGDKVRYFSPTSQLTELLFEARDVEAPNKRWSVLEYEVIGSRFDVKMKYPEEVPVESFDDDDRREIALQKRFGKKPVIYPPAPEGWMELRDQEN